MRGDPNHLLSGMILQASPSAKALACIAISVVSQLKGAEQFFWRFVGVAGELTS